MLKCKIVEGEVCSIHVSGEISEVIADYGLIGRILYENMNSEQKKVFKKIVVDDEFFAKAITGQIKELELDEDEEDEKKHLHKKVEKLDCPDYVKKALEKMIDEM